MKSHVASGKARLVQGDALNEEDVRRAWAVASEGDGPLDLVLFTVGQSASSFHLKKLNFLVLLRRLPEIQRN